MNKEDKKKPFVEQVSLTVDNSLVDEITDMLDGVEEGKKIYFTFADFFRSAILNYSNDKFKMSSLKRRAGIKKTFSLRLDKECYDFYNSIPKGKKSDWLERILVAYKLRELG